MLTRADTIALVDQMRARTIEHATARLMGLVDVACTTLLKVMTSEESSPAAQVSAARVVLTSILPMREATDLETRHYEVEQQLARRLALTGGIVIGGRRSAISQPG